MPTWSGKSLGESMGKFYADLEKVGRDLTGPEKRKITRDMALKARTIAVKAASADLGGDPRFSGWDRDLSDLKVKPGSQGQHWMFPTRKSGGPWKVAEQGRNQGGATGRGGVQAFHGPSIDRKSGDTFRTKTGKVRMTRSRRGWRWNGRTQGKRTGSKATAAMERQIPDVAAKGVLRVTRKRFDVS